MTAVPGTLESAGYFVVREQRLQICEGECQRVGDETCDFDFVSRGINWLGERAVVSVVGVAEGEEAVSD